MKYISAVLYFLVVAVFAVPDGVVRAQSLEVLYLSDSVGTGDGISKIFRVDLDSATGHAILTPLPDAGYGPGVVPFNQVDALAATPDGKKIYAIDKYTRVNSPGTGKLGCYDVATALWTEIGEVKTAGASAPVPGIVLLAFSPGWVMYAVSQNTDSLYKVDTATGEAVLIGKIVNEATDVKVNVLGADIAFGADGTLYLWTNKENVSNPAGAPRGLYVLNIPLATPGKVKATFIGEDLAENHFYTGLAVRANGLGDLVGSTHQNHIHVVERASGNSIQVFDMYLGGSPYRYAFGDMTSGPLFLCTYTIGYWKNHSWNGASAVICGIVQDESAGGDILWNANAKNFSMLFAQLIAAKLNTNNAPGIEIIDNAESWLCSVPGIVVQGNLDWNKAYEEGEKWRAVKYAKALDDFNNRFECE